MYGRTFTWMAVKMMLMAACYLSRTPKCTEGKFTVMSVVLAKKKAVLGKMAKYLSFV